MKKERCRRVRRISFVLLSLCFLLSVGVSAKTRTVERVTVTGHGRVTAPADRVELYVSVEGHGATETEASELRDRKADALERALHGETLSRTSSYVGSDGCGGYTAVFGYVLQSDRPTEIAKTADALRKAGASCISEPIWLLSDPTRWEREALAQAITDAEARATVCGAGNRLAVLHDHGSYTACGGGPSPTVTVEATVMAVFVKES